MLTVIIIAKNEAERIRYCLESVLFADEIIVLDSGSTDDTIAIAKEYTAKVFSTDWPGYGIQKQRALDKASSKWVLNLDADEFLSDALQAEIKQAIACDTADAYRLPIRMHFNDTPLKYSWTPKRHVRLFKRSHGQYSRDMVHEKIILSPNSRVNKMKHYIMHHSFRDVKHALYKINQYSSHSATIRNQSNKKTSLTKILLGTSWMFFRCYLLQRGFLDGRLGFLFAVFSAQGTFYRGIKQIYQDKDDKDVKFFDK